MDESRVITVTRETVIDSAERLKDIIHNQNPILMVGAGSSKIAGYPSWDELIKELNKLTPSLKQNHGEDPIEYADRIKKYLNEKEKIDQYFNFLQKTFEPKSKCFDKFHQSLLNIGFSGIVTTNYDKVLELAAYQSYGSWYYSIDLCSLEQRYGVLNYLRSLSKNKERNSKNQERNYILHLHGYFETPKKIILTQIDYLHAYGEIKPNNEKMEHDQVLHTFHRKVIWSLLATHPLVFIGFSMKDKFFLNMLEIVKKDFDIDPESTDSEPIHFAIMPDEDKEITTQKLKYLRVSPLFYPHTDDHRGLQDLIFKVEHLIKKNSVSYELSETDISQDTSTDKESEENKYQQPVSLIPQSNFPGLDEINKKMLEL